MRASVLLASSLGEYHVPSVVDNATGVMVGELVSFIYRFAPDERGLWVVLEVFYTGPATRGSWAVAIEVPLLQDQFSCLLPPFSALVSLTLNLEAAEPISAAVGLVADSVTVLGVVMPTGLIRAGMLSSLMGMMRCSEFDPAEELSFMNNPTGLPVGASGPRYQRSSAVTVLVALGGMTVILSAAVGGLIKFGECDGRAAVDLLRLPSSVLPIILILSEMGVSSAATLIVYDPGNGGDVVLGLTVLCPFLGFVVLQALRVVNGNYRIERVKHAEEGKQTIVQYLLDPTHEIGSANEQWVRRNFYFVDGRSWPLFGVVEVTIGLVSNILEGIPVTSSLTGLCAARPACILGMSLVLIAILLYRVPNAVRLSQASAVVTTALMCTCSAVVLANVVSPSEMTESGATYLGLVVSVVNGALGLLEVVGLLLTVVPQLGSPFDLKSRTLEAAISRVTISGSEVAMLQLPTIVTTAPPSQPVVSSTTQHHTASGGRSKEELDDDWAKALIAKLHASI